MHFILQFIEWKVIFFYNVYCLFILGHSYCIHITTDWFETEKATYSNCIT